jgi:hypothetical protein
MQSLLYVEYINKKYGDKAIGKLLAAYEEGLETDAAIEKVFKVGKPAFEKDYVAFLKAACPRK